MNCTSVMIDEHKKINFHILEQTFSVHREVYHANKSIYVVMSFGGIIIFVSMVIGLIILRKRGAATRNYVS